MRVLAVAALLAVLNLPVAAGAVTPIPDQKPDFAPIAYLIGTWACKAGTPGGVVHPLTTEYSYILDGRWIHEHTVSPAHDASRTYPYLWDSNTGYDGVKKRWVSLGVSNTGDYSIEYAPVMADGSLHYSGTDVSGARLSTFHGTWIKISETEMRYAGATSTGRNFVQRCSKIAR